MSLGEAEFSILKQELANSRQSEFVNFNFKKSKFVNFKQQLLSILEAICKTLKTELAELATVS